jgi:hypothetical protein
MRFAVFARGESSQALITAAGAGIQLAPVIGPDRR